MIWRVPACLAIALFCAGCVPKGDAERLAEVHVSNPWIVTHVENEDGTYLEAIYDPRPLGPELCLASRVRIPLKIHWDAYYGETMQELVIAYSPCRDAHASQFGHLWPNGVRWFSGAELHEAFTDLAAVIAHGTHAVPGVDVDPWADCSLRSQIKWDNFESAVEERGPGESGGQIDIEFLTMRDSPQYRGSVFPANLLVLFHVLFKDHHVAKIEAFYYGVTGHQDCV